MPRLLDKANLAVVHRISTHSSVDQMLDRRANLAYKHAAYRVQLPLRAQASGACELLLRRMLWADNFVW